MKCWIWLVIIAYIVIGFITGEAFQSIATTKGFPQSRYFWLPFLFGIIGCLTVVALPDRGGVVSEKPVTEDEIPDI